MEPLNQRRREANTVNVLWTQCGDEHQRCKPSAAARWLLAASETRVKHGSSLNDPWLRRSISSGVNYQLESRMQEICQSGSEGGAKPTFVPTPITPGKNPSRRVRDDRGSQSQRIFLIVMCAVFFRKA